MTSKPKAYLDLIRHAVAAGLSMKVDDGDDELIPCKGYQDAKDAVEAVEEAHIQFYKDGHYIGWAFIILPGPGAVDNEESVADYGIPRDDTIPQDDPRRFVDNWFNDFFARTS